MQTRRLPPHRQFVRTVTNTYLPWIPGARWYYVGGGERIQVCVQHRTRRIEGIQATVVRDTVKVGDKTIEDTFDWYAQDRRGNVWYLGENTREYEHGHVVSREGSWEAGPTAQLPASPCSLTRASVCPRVETAATGHRRRAHATRASPSSSRSHLSVEARWTSPSRTDDTDGSDAATLVRMDAVVLVWERVIARQPRPADGVALASALVAVALVAIRTSWTLARHAVTIVHEGAHGFVAMLCGRQLAGIRLHSDSSGVSVSKGRPSGPGMVATAAAGYVGPAVLGLACAWLLSQRHAVAVLWLLLVALALLLVQIRNFFGLLVVLASGAALFVVSWRLDVDAQVSAAYVVTWFLLLAAPRPVLELQAARRRGRARGSDADQLGRLTPLPALAWVGVFLSATVGALFVGAGVLLV